MVFLDALLSGGRNYYNIFLLQFVCLFLDCGLPLHSKDILDCGPIECY